MRGVEVLNNVNTWVRPGVWLALATTALVTRDNASEPRPARSCTYILKPPPVPMPGTEGGGITRMKASCSAPI